ncbi:Peptidase C45 [Niveomyces insectorum RCEF 264]|uniref:Peptidase C45 n=1 Tax=Niveomyces insectorum RCEF 264 TaxID=1081102 RepID=A0A167T3M6_9HYPO|nr:Peptidase C45 [Niveomyces insectorum RCEF 264]
MPSPALFPKKFLLKGSPKEIGFQHGEQLQAEIRSQIDVYDAMFQYTSKLNWAAVREVAQAYHDTVARLTPDIYAEMQGIADGSGRDILDIVALNCRSEIALGLFSDGCSALGWQSAGDAGDETQERDGVVVLAQNWDWTPQVQSNLALLTIEQDDGRPTVHMMVEAGLVGKIGFNSASVGVCQNAIRARPTDPSRLPYHVACRIALNSTSVAAAVKAIQDMGGIASTQHLLMADRKSGPLSCEMSPRGDAFIKPDPLDGIVCHTNHLLANKFVDEPPWLAGSPVRLQRIQKLTAQLAREGGFITGDVLRARIFSDTFNAPQAICCQGDPDWPIETRSQTLMCIVMFLGSGTTPRAEIVWGQPGSGSESEVIHFY